MIVFLVSIFIASMILNGVLGYSTFNLLRKNEVTEDYIIQSYFEGKRALDDMRAIDNMEMFEKDDDVGMVFNQMIQIVDDYARFLGVGEEATEETE